MKLLGLYILESNSHGKSLRYLHRLLLRIPAVVVFDIKNLDFGLP